jgi:hypothetical protein
MNATRDMLEETVKQSEGTVRALTLAELHAVSGAIAVLPTYPGGQKPSPTFPPIPE